MRRFNKPRKKGYHNCKYIGVMNASFGSVADEAVYHYLMPGRAMKLGGRQEID